jgi:hypothetical protein
MFSNPVFISLFLLVFGVLWILACGLIAWQSGWNKFSKTQTFDEKREVLSSLNFSSIQFNNFGSYNYSILISFHKDGLSLKPLLLFKAFHKPLFIEWKEISKIEEKKEFFWYPALDVYVKGNKIRFYGDAIGAIKNNPSLR